jgi:hypothetical protein
LKAQNRTTAFSVSLGAVFYVGGDDRQVRNRVITAFDHCYP